MTGGTTAHVDPLPMAGAMFAPLRAIGGEVAAGVWPSTEQLSGWAAARDARTGCGQPLRFEELSGPAAPGAADYEQGIHDRGVVPLRAANRHDLFNALVWLAFPRTKAALNRAHAEELRAHPHAAGRNVRRDALTLLDESGVLVLSSERAVLEGIRAFDWKHVFWTERETLLRTTRFLLFGHGLYEKALAPYVGMTGHALLLEAPAVADGSDVADLAAQGALNAEVDALAADAVLTQLAQPRVLAPLPVLGVPGWWAANSDPAFYDNAAYFRPGRTREKLRQDTRSEARVGPTR